MKKQILGYIEKFRKKHGYAPSQTDIAKELETSRQNVNHHFHGLKDDLMKYPEYRQFFK
jgi:biotin operon repressor